MYRHLNGTHHAGENEFQLILAAGLIRRCARISSQEIYEKAVACFESLVEITESEEMASKVSSLIDDPVPSVRETAKAIIDRLLFNSANNPYLSLGLSENTGRAEVAKRWKRLIVLYHPDKYPDQKEYEEKAKKINEAYKEIQTRETKNFQPLPDSSVTAEIPPVMDAAHYTKYLRRVPACILALAIFSAILSILFFIRTIQNDRQPDRRHTEKTGSYHSLSGLPAPAAMQHVRGSRREAEKGGGA
jgi:hypothetical protein